jgi:hypothetical protein
MTEDDVGALMRAVKEHHRLHTLAIDENADVELRVTAATALLDMAGYAPLPPGHSARTLDELDAELTRVKAEIARREAL